MKHIEKWASRQKDIQAPSPREMMLLVEKTIKHIKEGEKRLR